MKVEDANCNMFHSSQQSSAMLNESRQQNLLCFEQMRQFMSCNYRFQMTGATLPRPSLPRTIKMTMEVQNNDFASLVGQTEAWTENDSIADIMHDTGCIIQFADQYVADVERNPAFFNQVTICGEFPSIDEAQRRIRNLSPITIAISLKCVKTALARSVAAGKSLSSFVMDWCAPQGKLSRFGRIHFNVAQAPNWYSRSVGKDPFLIIRGSYSDREEILKASKEACILLFDLAVKNEFCARLEIPVLQRRWVVGSPDGVLMRTISTMSGATIHFPVSSKGLTPTSYYITGCAESCLEAVRMFYAVSPVRLDFEVDNLHLNKQIPSEKSREFDCFDTKHNVIISMRKSQYEGGFRLENEKMRHSVSLMTSEENLNNMYAVRRVLLKDKMYRAEKAPSNRRAGRPCFIDYLRVLVAEAAPPEKTQSKIFNRFHKPNMVGDTPVQFSPGDGIGPEMMEHIKRIFAFAHIPVDFEEIDLSSNDPGNEALESAITAVKRNGIAIKGNIETKFDSPQFKSRNVEIRRRLDLYANVLHCVSIPTIPCRHRDINIVLIRENTEGEYSGLEHESVPGVVESIKIVTRRNIERISRFAFEYAILNKKSKITAVHKANIQKLGDGLFLQVCKEMSEKKEYKHIQFDSMIVDNASMQLVSRPQQFNNGIMLMPNLYGNIISNIACGLTGGPGLVSGMNIGDKFAVFETGTRNTGTSLAGKDIANPTAFIRAAVDMLRYLELDEYADKLSDALYKALTQQKTHTPDIGGANKTSDVIEAVLENLRDQC